MMAAIIPRSDSRQGTTGETEGAGPLSDCPKLLSHRGRGFGYPEATVEAARAALRSGVRYLELDTRVDADGVIRARHGARIRTAFGLTALHDLPAERSEEHTSELQS